VELIDAETRLPGSFKPSEKAIIHVLAEKVTVKLLARHVVQRNFRGSGARRDPCQATSFGGTVLRKFCLTLTASLDTRLCRQPEPELLLSSLKKRGGNCRTQTAKGRCRSLRVGGQSATPPSLAWKSRITYKGYLETCEAEGLIFE